MFTMLTCFYTLLWVSTGGLIVLTFIVGEMIDFGEDAFHAVEGAVHGLGSIGDRLDGLLHGAEGAAAIDHGDISLPDANHEGLQQGPGIFGCRTVLMFICGFGAGGNIGIALGLSDFWSLGPAFGVGFLLGGVMWFTMRQLYAAQGSSSIKDSDYLNVVGRVIIPIPAEGRGQVALDVMGQRMNMPATSTDKTPIPANAEVYVVSKEGGVLTVEKL